MSLQKYGVQLLVGGDYELVPLEHADEEVYLASDVDAEIARLRAAVAELRCPKASGFEGPETFPDCGKCIVCECKKLTTP